MHNSQMVVTRHGGAEVLELRQAALPIPGRGAVRIAVLTCGLSFADVLIRAGTYPGAPSPPFVTGYDFIGQVDACGPGVTSLHPGDLVAGLPVTGALTRFFVAPEHELVVLPAGADPIICACLPLNYMAAYQMLTRAASLRSGDPILVQGASGGVGTALLDLGRCMGLKLIGTGSRERAEIVEGYGATFIDRRAADQVQQVRAASGSGVAAAFDGIGGAVAERSYQALRPQGRLVLYGHYSTLVAGVADRGHLARFYVSAAQVLARSVLPGGRRVVRYQIAKWKQRHPDWYRADLLHLVELARQGSIAPLVARTLPFTEAQHAHELLDQGGVVGTMVLRVAPHASEP